MIARIRRRLTRATDNDSGSALILALLVVLVTSVTLGVMLDFAGAGLAIAPKTRDLRNDANTLQGAVDGAINNIRTSSAYGKVGGPACPTFNPGSTSLVGATATYSVTCTPLSPTGGTGDVDQPDFAIHALGSGAGDGIHSSGNATLTIDGGLFANGDIAVNGPAKNTISVNGSVFSRAPAPAPCPIPLLSSTDITGVHCRYTGPSGGGSFGDDPQYLAAVANAAALTDLIGPDTTALNNAGADPVPGACVNGMVVFEPAYYSKTPESLAALSACSSSTYHFKPGRYYFNFAGLWDPSPSKNLQLVGGTLRSTFAAGGALGTACLTDQPGVQFIFGGTSQINVNTNSQIELCAPLSSQGFTGSPQRIALYGLSANANNNAGVPPATVPDVRRESLAPPTPGGETPGFSGAANAQRITQPGDIPATANVTATDKKQTATLSFGGFSHVPKGADVTALNIRVAQAVVGGGASELHVTAGSPAVTKDYPLDALCLSTAPCTIGMAKLSTDFPGPLWRTLNTMTVSYSVESKDSGDTAAVDGVDVLVSYVPPALVRHDCGVCTLFSSAGNLNVFLHGTVYSPSAAWSVEVHNNSGTIFDRGIVIRTIEITVSASSKQTTAPFRLPAATPQGRLVLFRGSVNGVERLRACVLYTDQIGTGTSALAFAGHRLSVRHWAAYQDSSSESPDCL